MNRSVAAAVVAALAIIGTVALRGPPAEDDGVPVFVTTLELVDTPSDVVPLRLGEKQLNPSRLAMLPDGGKGYVAEAVTSQGIELREVPAGCARRRASDDCTFVDGGVLSVGSRYPAALLTGPDCRPVACAIYAGDDPDADEDATLQLRKSEVVQ